MSALSLPSILHASQSLLSLYTAYYAYLSVTKTQTYEAPTAKAAKYSNTAEYHLWQTRKTLGGGVLGVLASLLTSLSLISASSTSPEVLSLTSFALALYLAFSHKHISNYWRNSAKIPIPKMGDYNDAISTTAVMRACIGFLGISWGCAGGVYLWKALF